MVVGSTRMGSTTTKCQIKLTLFPFYLRQYDSTYILPKSVLSVTYILSEKFKIFA